MTTEETFINSISGQAKEEMKKHKILASLIIAQAILESSWGKSGLSVNGKNLFGVKASSGWKGETVTMPTREYSNGKYITINQSFRKYRTWSESILDHSALLLNARYKNLIGENDYRKACKKIYIDGYATDVMYSDLLIRIIEKYKLYNFDKECHIERVLNMDIKVIQRWLNNNGFTDGEGKKLVEDGVAGIKTTQAKEKAKTILNYIIK